MLKNNIEYHENNADDLKDVLVGRRIVSAEKNQYGNGEFILDDGTHLFLTPNMGCGGCPNGLYELNAISDANNAVIMSVKSSVDGRDYGEKTYSLFVYTDGVSSGSEMFSVSGDDGNGYYGTGYTVEVTREK